MTNNLFKRALETRWTRSSVVALLTTMIATVQRFSTNDVAKVPTIHVYKLCTNAVTSGLLLALAGGVRKVSQWAA
jgi:hypothetical protein